MEQIGVTDGRKRVVVEAVKPEVESGRYPVKRVPDEWVVVEADIFGDGHDVLDCLLLYRKKENTTWKEAPMRLIGNDRWRASFQVKEIGCYV